jgi:hypothetical protein
MFLFSSSLGNPYYRIQVLPVSVYIMCEHGLLGKERDRYKERNRPSTHWEKGCSFTRCRKKKTRYRAGVCRLLCCFSPNCAWGVHWCLSFRCHKLFASQPASQPCDKMIHKDSRLSNHMCSEMLLHITPYHTLFSPFFPFFLFFFFWLGQPIIRIICRPRTSLCQKHGKKGLLHKADVKTKERGGGKGSCCL